MKKRVNHTIDESIIEDLKQTSEIMGVNQSKIVNDILKRGLEDIKKLNYNYSELIRR